MERRDRTIERLLRGSSDADFSFTEICTLLRRMGFAERVRGDHHIFTRHGVAEILNLQPRQGKAKPYQVKQVRSVVLKYSLGGGRDAV
ncbi:MAG: type II toxin-antitoxin system HicA family toxin [Candidatus Bipolaricaulota bacterium]